MWIKKIENGGENAFEGKRSLILYASGCNLRCPFCGFASLISEKKTDDCLDLNGVLKYLSKRLSRYDGVVISGGEPTHHSVLEEWILAIRNLGLAIKLETNGTYPEILRSLLEKKIIDYIAMDVKAPLINYGMISGVRMDPELIRSSIWVIKQSGIPHEFCTTVVPGLHTTREIKAIAELVHGADKYVVQDFISTEPLRRDLKGRPAFPKKALEDMRKYIERRVKVYEIRHSDEAKQMPTLKRRVRQSLVRV